MTDKHTCENCGLPSGAVTGKGTFVVVEAKPENRFQKTRKRSVWCCTDECAIQSLAVSKYGRTSHKWPITLAQFRATKPLAQGQTVTKRARASRKAKELVWGESEAMGRQQESVIPLV